MPRSDFGWFGMGQGGPDLMQWALFLAIAEGFVLSLVFIRGWRGRRERQRQNCDSPRISRTSAPVSFAERQKAALRHENCVCVCRHERLTGGGANRRDRWN